MSLMKKYILCVWCVVCVCGVLWTPEHFLVQICVGFVYTAGWLVETGKREIIYITTVQVKVPFTLLSNGYQLANHHKIKITNHKHRLKKAPKAPLPKRQKGKVREVY